MQHDKRMDRILINQKIFDLCDVNNITVKKNNNKNHAKKNDLPSSNDAVSDNNKNNNEPDTVPVYDGEEPYFLFKRRWDKFILRKQNMALHANILNLLNDLFRSKYTNLSSMKKITIDMVPSYKIFCSVIESKEEYKSLIDINECKIVSPIKLLNKLLNRIGFSIIKVDTSKTIYYSIRPYQVNNQHL
jgi:hypothetical protein